MGTKVGIAVLGDEVLKGEVREENLAYMLPLLNAWGADVRFCAILPDETEVVARALSSWLGETDLIVLTGGIGPTPDDITRDAVARAAGVPLVVHPEAKAALEAFYGESLNPYRMLMAHVPQGAVLIPNPRSGAPGFFVGRMAAFPGIPRLLREMFGWLRPLVEGPRRSRVIVTTGAPESAFAGIMKDVMEAFPDVSVGSYPVLGAGYRARLVFRAVSFGRAAACAGVFTDRLAETGWTILGREEEHGDVAPE